MTEPKGKKILCIEDNPMNWKLVNRLLGNAGYETHWAEEGLKGYEMALELRPDLILMDINLPGLSGYEITTKLRQNPTMKDVPIVALTAKTLKGDKETALATGCDGFIAKPIDPFQFVNQVEAYLKGQRDRLEKGQEGQVLRKFSQELVEHLESQLNQAREANEKLKEAQLALEQRNQQLSRLLSLSQAIFLDHDPFDLMDHIFRQICVELDLNTLHAYRIHSSEGYLEGIRRVNGELVRKLPLSMQDRLVLLLTQEQDNRLLYGDDLVHSSFWDPGLRLGFWSNCSEACLLSLWDKHGEKRLWGIVAFSRTVGKRFKSHEIELAGLYAGICQTALSNLSLIETLNESHRALAQSFERMESAYVDLQQTQTALLSSERQALAGDLLLKMTEKLRVPMVNMHQHLVPLEEITDQLSSSVDGHSMDQLNLGRMHLTGIKLAAHQVESLVSALMRRAGQFVDTMPVYLELHDMIRQELELLKGDGTIPAAVQVEMDLQAQIRTIYGLYNDLADLVYYLVQHSLESKPLGTLHIHISTWNEDEHLVLMIRDNGSPLTAKMLGRALSPLSMGKKGMDPEDRAAGYGLHACAQLVESYEGSLEIRNWEHGTEIQVRFPV